MYQQIKRIVIASPPETGEAIPKRFFAEFTVSKGMRFFAPLRMTSEGVRMTESKGLVMTAVKKGVM